MDNMQLTVSYSVVQDSLCDDKSFPTNMPCSDDAHHVVNSKRNELNNSILGLISGTERPTTPFNNASSDNVQCATSGFFTRSMHRDEGAHTLGQAYNDNVQ